MKFFRTGNVSSSLVSEGLLRMWTQQWGFGQGSLPGFKMGTHFFSFFPLPFLPSSLPPSFPFFLPFPSFFPLSLCLYFSFYLCVYIFAYQRLKFGVLDILHLFYLETGSLTGPGAHRVAGWIHWLASFRDLPVSISGTWVMSDSWCGFLGGF